MNIVTQQYDPSGDVVSSVIPASMEDVGKVLVLDDSGKLSLGYPDGGSGAGIIPKNSIWVDPNGNDSTGNGSLGNPYKTIAFALSQVAGASQSNRFAIMVSPGRYIETAILLPAWTWIVGLCPQPDANPTAINLASGSVGLVSSWTGSGPLGGFSNIEFSCPVDLVNTADDIGIIISDCSFIDGFTVSFSGPGSYLDVYECSFYGDISCTQGEMFWFNFNTLGANVFNFGGGSVLNNGTFTNGLMLSQASGITGSDPISLQACSMPSLTISGTGLVVIADSISLPLKANLSVSGGASLVMSTDASSLAYSPATPGNWASTPPSSIQDALDRIAAKTPGA